MCSFWSLLLFSSSKFVYWHRQILFSDVCLLRWITFTLIVYVFTFTFINPSRHRFTTPLVYLTSSWIVVWISFSLQKKKKKSLTLWPNHGLWPCVSPSLPTLVRTCWCRERFVRSLDLTDHSNPTYLRWRLHDTSLIWKRTQVSRRSYHEGLIGVNWISPRIGILKVPKILDGLCIYFYIRLYRYNHK